MGGALRRFVVVPLVVLAVSALAWPAGASHSWGGYHWARTANPFTLRLGDNVSTTWDSHLRAASTDWTQSTVLDTTVVAGQSVALLCSPRAGRAEVCSATYGPNGWLGLASVWTNGNHITQATVKMNDFYFSMASYNTPAWRQSVMCQEIGHVFGLSHQDEIHTNANLGSCMDYTNNPSTNQRPNAHDYAQLRTSYHAGRIDGSTTTAAREATAPAEHEHAEDGDVRRGTHVVRVRDLGGGLTEVTVARRAPERPTG